MKKVRIILVILVVSPILCFSQKTIKCDDASRNKHDFDIYEFSSASIFFFSTLEQNFGGTKGENIFALMKIISSSVNKQEDFFRLQVENKKFRSLNKSLARKYDNIYPIHIYINEENSERNYIRENGIINDVRDTIEIRIPSNMPCPISKNSFLEGSFKFSFVQQLLNDKSESTIKSFIIDFLNGTGLYSALDLSINCIKNFNEEELENIFNNEYERILVSLVFWEYLSESANYDLNTRKYFYED